MINQFWRDVAERTVWVAAAAFLGALAVPEVFGADGLSVLKSAGIAAGSAALEFLRGVVARRTGDPSNASFLSR